MSIRTEHVRPVASQSRWASAARALAGAAVLLALPVLAPASAEAVEIKLLDTGNPHASLVEVSGTIRKGDARAIETFISRLPADKPVSVRLNSGGGHIVEALAIGRYFHRAMIRTYVVGAGARCVSACALAFLGGRDTINGKSFRVKSTDAALAFQGFNSNEPDKEFTVADLRRATTETQNLILLIAEYMTDIDADMDFMIATLTVTGNADNLMSDAKAVSLGIHVLNEQTGEFIRGASRGTRVASAS